MHPPIWDWPFKAKDWAALAAEYRELVEGDLPQLAPVLSVIESVIENRMDTQLAVTTSLRDLAITTAPPQEPPVDVIVVRSAVSGAPPATGTIAIDHVATTGLSEHIVRPEAETLPLFWRFVAEKYGLRVTR